MTVRALLDELSRHALDAAEMQAVGEQMARLQKTDADAWTSHVGEGDAWEERTVESLDT